MGQTIKREACSYCKSTNNLCTFQLDDGRTLKQCKTPNCSFNRKKESLIQKKKYRCISEKTLQYYNCELLESEIIYDYLTAKKHRSVTEKKFWWDPKKTVDISLFGLHLFNDFSRPIIITEGENDAMSCYEVGYQAVSLWGGASNHAAKEISFDSSKLLKFSEIILCLDNDSAGNTAKAAILKILPKNKVKVIDLETFKDANEALQVGTLKDILDSQVLNYIPNGLVYGSQIDYNDLRAPLPPPISTPFKKLNDMTKGGVRSGQLWLLTGGSSIGKSSILREMCMHFFKNGLSIANIFVEESSKVPPLVYLDSPIPIGDLMSNPELIGISEWERLCHERLNTDKLVFIDKYWKRSTENLISTVKYLINKNFNIVVLDHLSAIISSSATSKKGLVGDIDELMEALFSLVSDSKTTIIAASHLSKPQAPPYWDEGRKPSMYDIKGSGSLAQKPDVIIGISRNQKDITRCDLVQLEVLKNRWFSQLGLADELTYITKTGKLMV